MSSKSESRDEWEIREDVRTLEQAQKIRNDPQRLREVQTMIKQQRQAQDSILSMKPPEVRPLPTNPATRGALPIYRQEGK